jgi:hypothetical protein
VENRPVADSDPVRSRNIPFLNIATVNAWTALHRTCFARKVRLET